MLLIKSGKVKDVYVVNDKELEFEFSNRISVFDKIIPSEIPNKDFILNGILSNVQKKITNSNKGKVKIKYFPAFLSVRMKFQSDFINITIRIFSH